MTTIMLIIIGLLVTALIYISRNTLKKMEFLEDVVEFQNKYITQFSSKVVEMNQMLEELDSKGSFKADDEVGYFFESLKGLQEDLNVFILESSKNEEKR